MGNPPNTQTHRERFKGFPAAAAPMGMVRALHQCGEEASVQNGIARWLKQAQRPSVAPCTNDERSISTLTVESPLVTQRV